MTTSANIPETVDLFASADWYERTINWDARIARELPILCEVLGPPRAGGILDAGCGTGHQATALAKRGYRVVGADLSEAMLHIARRTATGVDDDRIRFALAPYAELYQTVGGGFDGVYCLGNALAAAGTREAVARSIEQFSKCLRSGGRLFVQILNFKPVCEETPCVKGPRIARAGDTEYISVRQFHSVEDRLQVTNISLWQDDTGWRQRAHGGFLYPLTLDELRDRLTRCDLQIDELWGGYDKAAFHEDKSNDLIVVATRV